MNSCLVSSFGESYTEASEAQAIYGLELMPIIIKSGKDQQKFQ